MQTVYKAPSYSDIFYIGPTNQDAMDIIWDSLEERLSKTGWKYKPLISKQRIELSRKRKIYVIGAEKIRRIRGHKVIAVYPDELAYYDVDLNYMWKAVRPTLTDLKGKCVAATTPNGKGTQAYDWYIDKVVDGDAWKYFHWTTEENPYIDPEELAEAKREMDEKAYAQEYQATWESFEGLAYHSFDESLNVCKQPPIYFDVPLHLAFDFNVNPTTLLLSQKDGRIMRYKKEYSQKNSSTEQTVIDFCEDYKEHASRIPIKIRGDAAGRNRSSTTGKSDYKYVEEILGDYGFSYEKEVKSHNPAIVDRVKVANAWLKPFRGGHRVEIDPGCNELIRDLSSQELKGRIPSDKNNRGHKADAFGYDIYYEATLEGYKATYSRQL